MVEIQIKPEVLAYAQSKLLKTDIPQVTDEQKFGADKDRILYGYVGEKIVMDYLDLKEESRVNTYEYDLIDKDGFKIEVKTIKCKSKPLLHYDCTINGYKDDMVHKQNADKYYFVRIRNDFNVAWIVGWYPCKKFQEEGDYNKKGKQYAEGFGLNRSDTITMAISQINQIDPSPADPQIKNKIEWKLDEIKPIAKFYCELFRPYCERIEIAGSIRREKTYVHDIELVCIPKTAMVQVGLFQEERRDPGFIDLVASIPKMKGNGEGKYTRLILKEGINMDLFMTTKPQFGIIFMIRTGSSDYSRRMVTEIKPNYWVKDGFLYSHAGKHECPEEEDFYKITGMEFLPPSLRSF